MGRTGVAVPVSTWERLARGSDIVRMVAEALADIARSEAMEACEETRLYLRARGLASTLTGVARVSVDTLARLAAKHAESHEDFASEINPDAKEGTIPGSCPLA